MFDLEHLRVLHHIVEAGSFRKASDVMYRSQPALTAAMKKLEQGLGFELFDRSKYRATLTAKGKAFYKKAQVLLQQYDVLKHTQT